jgi:hypothetical protein
VIMTPAIAGCSERSMTLPYAALPSDACGSQSDAKIGDNKLE